MSKPHMDKSKIYKFAAILLAVVFLVSAGFVFLHWWEQKQNDFPVWDAGQEYVAHDGQKYALKKNVETFLVLGLDKFKKDFSEESYNNDRQADFVMLFVFDHDTKTCTPLQINRDTMTEINQLGINGNPVGSFIGQLALSHTYGDGDKQSCRNAADAVSNLLLGSKINHYLSITMDAVPLYNDLLGGVEVEVLDDFKGIDDSLVKGQKVTLKGAQALTYVRSRYGLDDSTNNTRMNRQRQYLNALYAQSMEKIQSDDTFIVDATLKMSEYMVTDRSVTQLQELMRKFQAYEVTSIQHLQGEMKQGEKFMEFYPNKDALQETVIGLFYQRVQE